MCSSQSTEVYVTVSIQLHVIVGSLEKALPGQLNIVACMLLCHSQ